MEIKEECALSILTGHEIKMQQAAGGLYIEEFSEDRLNPNSYNLRLAPELLVYTEAVLDPKQNNRTREIIIPEDGYVLKPGRRKQASLRKGKRRNETCRA